MDLVGRFSLFIHFDCATLSQKGLVREHVNTFPSTTRVSPLIRVDPFSLSFHLLLHASHLLAHCFLIAVHAH